MDALQAPAVAGAEALAPCERVSRDTAEAAKALTELVAKFTAYVARRLPQDVLDRLTELRAREAKPLSRGVYDAMFENLATTDRLDRRCCQDTGALQYIVRAGARFPLLGELGAILDDAMRQATRDAPVRANAVETFVESNTETGMPWVEWEVVPDDDTCTIEVCMAGGGCSLPGALIRALMPATGYEAIVQFVLDIVTSSAFNACPPLLVGVGVSTSVETAAVLSKRAILRPLGTRHPDPQAARMEALLEQGLNDLGIGAQGLSGGASVLGVHVASSAGHASTIGVAVCVGCWAYRRGTLRIGPDLAREILSHKGVTL